MFSICVCLEIKCLKPLKHFFFCEAFGLGGQMLSQLAKDTGFEGDEIHYRKVACHYCSQSCSEVF